MASKKTSNMLGRTTVLAIIAVIGLIFVGGRVIATSQQTGDEEAVNVKKSKLKLFIRVVGGEDGHPKAQFKPGDAVAVELLVKNMSAEAAEMRLDDPFFQYRLQLLRVDDRTVVPYRDEVSELIARREDEPGPGRKFTPDPIAPSKSLTLGTLNLQDWYGQLEPGKYQLTVQYRSHGKKNKINSGTITFDVTP